jgi:iron complex transport system substrate-binding protein
VLAGKLIEMGYSVDRQKPIDIEFERRRFDAAFRIDLLVNRRLLVEINALSGSILLTQSSS